MQQQFKLNERRKLPFTAFTLDWRFNDCVRVCIGDNSLGYRELFSVVLSTFTDGKIYSPQGSAEMAAWLSMDGNENACLDGLNLLFECSAYSVYERKVIDALSKKLENEAGPFLTGALTGALCTDTPSSAMRLSAMKLSAMSLKRLKECENDTQLLYKWYESNVIQPITQQYINKLYSEKFIVSDYDTPLCIVALIESAFNRLVAHLIS